MDRYTTKQAQIQLRQAERAAQYPALWSSIISDWSSHSEEDCAWLMYSANYLLRTGGVRWAIDPLLLTARLALDTKINVSRDLEGLAFVLLTHQHADHLDLSLLRELRDLPIRFIIPEAIKRRVQSQAMLPEEQILISKASEPIEIEGIHITPCNGLHGETPAMAYLVEFCEKKWLFPGDVRIHDATRLPVIDCLDSVFAHLWLGKGCALEDEPSLLAPFCNFFKEIKPRRIVVTHLEELGRSAEDYWDRGHFLLVEKWFREHASHMQIECTMMGDKICF
jgi:hypothetical protein